MAVANLSIQGAWWGHGGNGNWTAADYIWVGKDSANYRSKVAVSTEGLHIITTERLVLAVTISGKSSPFGIECILTQDNTIQANDCQNSAVGAASQTLNDAAMARSFAYADEACTQLLSMDTGVNMEKGSTFYLKLEGLQLEQDKVYYLYFIRNLRDGYAGSGWTQADLPQIQAVLSYTNYTACGAPTWKPMESVYEGAVKLAWEPGSAGQSNPIKGYAIRATYSEDGLTWSEWEDVATTEDTEFTYSPQIERGSYAVFAVQTQGEANGYHSDWVNTPGATRRNRVPEAPEQILAPMVIGRDGAVEVSWPQCQDPDGHKVHYQVYRFQDDAWETVYEGEENSCRIRCQGEPGEVISLAVAAVDELGGYRENWTQLDGITFNSPPTAPRKVELDKGEYTPGETVTVRWEGTGDPDGNLAGVNVYGVPVDTGVAVLLGQVECTTGSGSYSFIPGLLEYQRSMVVAVEAYDSLGDVSGRTLSQGLRRNDRPHGHIFIDGIPGNYVPTIEGGRHMPYVRVNGQWVRHPGRR